MASRPARQVRHAPPASPSHQNRALHATASRLADALPPPHSQAPLQTSVMTARGPRCSSPPPRELLEYARPRMFPCLSSLPVRLAIVGVQRRHVVTSLLEFARAIKFAIRARRGGWTGDALSTSHCVRFVPSLLLLY
ncbi:hypothetical protein DFH09DRAFT_1309491 [Mycena vulgaris]|nr:hypothetical protein DFH09DRAFT_1309491 [Mycena vulgaris]